MEFFTIDRKAGAIFTCYVFDIIDWSDYQVTRMAFFCRFGRIARDCWETEASGCWKHTSGEFARNETSC